MPAPVEEAPDLAQRVRFDAVFRAVGGSAPCAQPICRNGFARISPSMVLLTMATTRSWLEV